MSFLGTLYTEVIYRPLLNGLVAIYGALPYPDLGIAIVLLTIAVRILLHPTVVSTVKTQLVMPRVQERIRELQKKYRDKPEEQARQSLAVYREFGVHPFASLWPLVVLIPISLALFQLFRTGIRLEDPTLIYSFLPSIAEFNPVAFGFIDLTARSTPLAILAGISQWLLARYTPKPPDLKGTTRDDFARAMQWQTTYIFPAIFAGIALALPAALALYWTVFNLLGILQQLLIQRRLHHGPYHEPHQPDPRADGHPGRS